MGLFDFVGDLFGAKKTSQSTQTGTSATTTQNQAFNDPRFQNFWNQFSTTFSNPNGAQVPVTPWQTNAADALAGTSQFIFPAYNAAGDVAQDGISVPSISKYMSPFTENVVNATQRQFGTQNAQQLAQTASQAAKIGAAGGTGGQVARMLTQQAQGTAQAPIIAGLYQSGYQNAVDTAAKDAATRTQAAATQGSLVGQMGNIWNSAYGAGQGIWDSMFKNAQSPYSIMAQGAQAWLPFLQGAGTTSNTNTSGTATGEQTSRDSLWNIGKGVLGAGMALFSDERVKHDISEVGRTFDGLPIYTFKYNDEPDGPTRMGLMAQDVERQKPQAVGDYHGVKTVDYAKATKANGGGVAGGNKPFHEKVMDAFRAVSEMKRASGGGVLPRYDMGGGVADPNWTAVVEKAPQSTPFQDWLGNGDIKAPADNDDMLGKQQQALSQMLSGMGRGMAHGGRIGHANGEGVWADDYYTGVAPAERPWADATPDSSVGYAGRTGFVTGNNDPFARAATPTVGTRQTAATRYAAPRVSAEMLRAPGSNWMPDGVFGAMFANAPKEGVVEGRPMSKWDRLTYLVSNAGISTDGSGKSGIGDALVGLSEDRRRDLEARNKAADLLMRQSMHPYDIQHKLAQTNLLNLQADKNYLLDLEKQKMEYAKQLELAKSKAEIEQLLSLREKFSKPGAASPGATRLQFIPNKTPDQPVEMTPPAGYDVQPAAPQPAATPVPAPETPPVDRRGNPIMGNTPGTAHPSRATAATGQYYKRPDGSVWRKSLLGDYADQPWTGG